MSPKVSIILPFFNAERFLRSALESVRKQTFGDFECICVDDGSTDLSAGIVEEYQQRDGRFRLIQQARKCAGVARNTGMSFATGECLAFLDADDSFEPDFLKEMCAAYDAEEDIEVVVCSVNLVDSGRKRSKRLGPSFLEMARFKDGDILNFTPGNPWNKLFSRALAKRMGFGFLDLPHSEDVGFVFPALAVAKRIAIVDKPLVNYRTDNAGSLEHTKARNGMLVFYDAYLSVRDRLMSLGVWNRVRASFVRRVGRAMLYNLRAPTDLGLLKAMIGRICASAEQDFDLLRDVPTDFDEELLRMKGGSFDRYVLRHLNGNPMGLVAVALICDEGYVGPTEVAIRSIIAHCSLDFAYDIRVIGTGLSEKSKLRLRSQSAGSIIVRVIDVDMGDLVGMHKFDAKAICVASEAALLKFQLPEILQDLQKVLYLDGDLVALSDVGELFRIDVSEYCAAVVRDSGQMYYRHEFVKRFPGYFNSGVMVLNLVRMRQERLSDNLIATKRHSADSSLMDQNVFNKVFCGRVRQLPPRWNFMPVSLDRSDDKWTVQDLNLLYGAHYESKRDVYDDAAIVHYSSKDKPWKTPDGAWSYVWHSYAHPETKIDCGQVALSVIIPCYNVEHYVRQTVESVMDQTVSLEIICLDDGSTDGTLSVLNSLAKDHPQVKVVANSRHGQGWERNVGLRNARGRYVHFMDADDLFHADAYAKLVEYTDRENLDVVLFEGESFYDSLELETSFASYRSAYKRGCAYPKIYAGKDLYVRQRLNGDMIVSPCLQLMRREFLIKEAITFSEDMAFMEDNLYSVSVLLKAKRVACLTDTLFRRRVRAESTMTVGRAPAVIARTVRQVVEGLVAMAEGERDMDVKHMLLRHALATIGRVKPDDALTALRERVKCLLAECPMSSVFGSASPAKASTIVGILSRMCQCYCDNGLMYTIRRILFGRQY